MDTNIFRATSTYTSGLKRSHIWGISGIKLVNISAFSLGFKSKWINGPDSKPNLREQHAQDFHHLQLKHRKKNNGIVSNL